MMASLQVALQQQQHQQQLHQPHHFQQQQQQQLQQQLQQHQKQQQQQQNQQMNNQSFQMIQSHRFSMDSTMSESKEGSTEKVSARLARNRATARNRRMRKKQVAETLTKTVAELTYHLELLNTTREGLSPAERKIVDQVVESKGAPPLACEFCERIFLSGPYRHQHYVKDHQADLKAREECRVLDNEAELGLSDDEDDKTPMSAEERRRRRLERNAASARQCRQRKKMYIESLRVQVPVLRHQIECLRAALPVVGVSLDALPVITDYTSTIETQLKGVKINLPRGTSTGATSPTGSRSSSPSQIERSRFASSSSDEGSHSTSTSPMSPSFQSASSLAAILSKHNDRRKRVSLSSPSSPDSGLSGILPSSGAMNGSLSTLGLNAPGSIGVAGLAAAAAASASSGGSGTEDAPIPRLSGWNSTFRNRSNSSNVATSEMSGGIMSGESGPNKRSRAESEAIGGFNNDGMQQRLLGLMQNPNGMQVQSQHSSLNAALLQQNMQLQQMLQQHQQQPQQHHHHQVQTSSPMLFNAQSLNFLSPALRQQQQQHAVMMAQFAAQQQQLQQHLMAATSASTTPTTHSASNNILMSTPLSSSLSSSLPVSTMSPLALTAAAMPTVGSSAPVTLPVVNTMHQQQAVVTADAAAVPSTRAPDSDDVMTAAMALFSLPAKPK